MCGNIFKSLHTQCAALSYVKVTSYHNKGSAIQSTSISSWNGAANTAARLWNSNKGGRACRVQTVKLCCNILSSQSRGLACVKWRAFDNSHHGHLAHIDLILGKRQVHDVHGLALCRLGNGQCGSIPDARQAQGQIVSLLAGLCSCYALPHTHSSREVRKAAPQQVHTAPSSSSLSDCKSGTHQSTAVCVAEGASSARPPPVTSTADTPGCDFKSS